uniref:Ig-like domain-containing protein n=1 Tax=Clastoptera arizonana TaxID=38151 RepID=A0A1B6C6B1_9HEMI
MFLYKYIDNRYIEPTRPYTPTNRSTFSSNSNYHQSTSSNYNSTKSSSNYQTSTSNVKDTSKSSSYQSTNKYSSTNSTDTSDKRSIKKYGSKLGTTSSPSRSRSATKELVLPPDDSMCPPEIAQHLIDKTVNDGDSLELTCYIKGDPEPQVSWLKNGQILSSSDVVDLKYRNGLATLSISEVFPEDEGTYVCRAINSLGTVESKGKITVLAIPSSISRKDGEDDGAPRIVSHLSSNFVKDGDPVCLSVRIIGAQKFDVIWLHNNKEIKPSKDFQYTNTANIYKLNIAEIFPEDSGIYTCEAFNDAGESFSSCSLIVLVPNEEPKSPVFKTFPRSLTVQEGESAEFECEFKDSVSSVSWLKDGKTIEEESSKYQFVQAGKKIPNENHQQYQQ